MRINLRKAPRNHGTQNSHARCTMAFGVRWRRQGQDMRWRWRQSSRLGSLDWSKGKSSPVFPWVFPWKSSLNQWNDWVFSIKTDLKPILTEHWICPIKLIGIPSNFPFNPWNDWGISYTWLPIWRSNGVFRGKSRIDGKWSIAKFYHGFVRHFFTKDHQKYVFSNSEKQLRGNQKTCCFFNSFVFIFKHDV